MSEPREPRSARRMFAVSVLASEVFVVLFATLVAHGLRVADRGTVWVAGGVVMVLCLLATGLVRRGRAGYVVGTAVQVLLLASGFLVPSMLVIGGIFVVLWVVSLRVGSRIDVERRARYEAELRHRAEQGQDREAHRHG
ncbi:hypothetical protein GCM10023169_18700 [Georgenia halophila]|uniref:DUF4233 domain-containing protein n=1 Tax=Georgenia halophila TaxID=620889 RepID=A0ABP8L7Z3_9MICO